MPVRQFERLSDLQTLSSRAQFFSLSNARDEIKASVFDDRAQLYRFLFSILHTARSKWIILGFIIMEVPCHT